MLVDFGSVRDATSSLAAGHGSVTGTFGYMAPEQMYGMATEGALAEDPPDAGAGGRSTGSRERAEAERRFAEAVASSRRSSFGDTETLVEVGHGWVDLGERERAMAMLRDLRSGTADAVYARILDQHLSAGRLEEAGAFVDQGPHYDGELELVLGLARIGQLANAAARANSLESTFERTLALSRLTRLEALVGNRPPVDGGTAR